MAISTAILAFMLLVISLYICGLLGFPGGAVPLSLAVLALTFVLLGIRLFRSQPPSSLAVESLEFALLLLGMFFMFMIAVTLLQRFIRYLTVTRRERYFCVGALIIYALSLTKILEDSTETWRHPTVRTAVVQRLAHIMFLARVNVEQLCLRTDADIDLMMREAVARTGRRFRTLQRRTLLGGPHERRGLIDPLIDLLPRVVDGNWDLLPGIPEYHSPVNVYAMAVRRVMGGIVATIPIASLGIATWLHVHISSTLKAPLLSGALAWLAVNLGAVLGYRGADGASAIQRLMTPLQSPSAAKHAGTAAQPFQEIP
jgi:hypothetical protein